MGVKPKVEGKACGRFTQWRGCLEDVRGVFLALKNSPFLTCGKRHEQSYTVGSKCGLDQQTELCQEYLGFFFLTRWQKWEVIVGALFSTV